MILVDTSAWIEFLRDTGSPVCQRVDDLLATEIATCDAVRMEVLAGARDEQHLQHLYEKDFHAWAIEQAYRLAAIETERETGLPETTFPTTCPF